MCIEIAEFHEIIKIIMLHSDTMLYVVFTTLPEKRYKNECAFLNDQ